MFPAYSADKTTTDRNNAPKSTLFSLEIEQIEASPKINSPTNKDIEWLCSKSFQLATLGLKPGDKDTEKITFVMETQDHERIPSPSSKHQKKEKKKKHKKDRKYEGNLKVKSIRKTSLVTTDVVLIEQDYLKFFVKFRSDELKKAHFYEDLPGKTIDLLMLFNSFGAHLIYFLL